MYIDFLLTSNDPPLPLPKDSFVGVSISRALRQEQLQLSLIPEGQIKSGFPPISSALSG